ncbi:hypothetical protein BO71DRAFT_400182 [Aspergillus ellipticus CBS 707.79]|uniref:Uncharacterized protein n=1 Tax=Aspergillus ellipticus CBS 707.79 TaxID=1448320 RepID=A0A319D6A5_9EURO|nr:hypothetical protein BO71DRAFT_400182 [Aspergillus ellipticus CBS 707.79]
MAMAWFSFPSSHGCCWPLSRSPQPQRTVQQLSIVRFGMFSAFAIRLVCPRSHSDPRNRPRTLTDTRQLT